jgi:hypothetical protein
LVFGVGVDGKGEEAEEEGGEDGDDLLAESGFNFASKAPHGGFLLGCGGGGEGGRRRTVRRHRRVVVFIKMSHSFFHKSIPK